MAALALLLAFLLAACGPADRAPGSGAASIPEAGNSQTTAPAEDKLPPGMALAEGLAVHCLVDRYGQYWQLDPRTQGAAIGYDRSSLIQAPDPAAFALQVMPLAVLATGEGSLVLATNRVGLYTLNLLPAGDGYRVQMAFVSGSNELFQGRTVGSAWTESGTPCFLLFRHDLYEPGVAASRVLCVQDGRAVPWRDFDALLAGNSAISGEASTVFPLKDGSWYLQFRKHSEGRVDNSYIRWNRSTGAVQALQRGEFEAALSAKPIDQAPALIKTLANGLSDSFVLDCLLPDGTRQAYSRGRPQDAVEGRLALSAWGAVLAMQDGRILALPASGGAVLPLSLNLPIPDLRLGNLAIAGDVLVQLWEEDRFPAVGRSGFSMVKLP